MFDDLHDPNPPHADSHHFATVVSRAKRLRHQRWAVSGGVLAATATLVISGAVVLGSDDDGAVMTDTTSVPTAPSTPETAPLTPETAPSTPPTAPSTTPQTPPTSPASTPATTPATTSTPPVRPLTCTNLTAGLGLIVPGSDGGVVRVIDGEEFALPDPGTRNPIVSALRGLDGTLWVESEVLRPARNGSTIHEIHRITPDGEVTLSARGDVALSGVGTLDAVGTAAVIIDSARSDTSESYGAIIVEAVDGTQTTVAPSGAPEYTAGSVTIGGQRLVEGAFTDLTESFRYYGLDHELLDDWYNPTAEAPYNMPPLYVWPVAAAWPQQTESPVRLSWVEGPDWDGTTQRVRGSWVLVVADPATGDEQLRLELGGDGKQLVHADFDGRFWVGTFDDTFDPERGDDTVDPSRVVVVDTLAESPSPVDGGCPAGVIATIDHLDEVVGEPDPGPDATDPAPPTTPDTTAVDCGVDTDVEEISANIDAVVPEPLSGVRWVYDGESNFDPCAALSYARLDVEGSTGSSPAHLMLFHYGEFIGTAESCAFGFTTVTATSPDSITVEYRWPRDGDTNAAPSGVASVTYRWDGGTVTTDPPRPGHLPAELLTVNGCPG